MHTGTTMHSLLSVPSDLFKERILSLLRIEDVARLDSAVLHHESREYFLDGLKGASIPPSEFNLTSKDSLKWLHSRHIHCKVLQFGHDITDDDIVLHVEALAQVVEVKFVCCQDIIGTCVAQIVNQSLDFRKLVFYNCCNIEYDAFYDLRFYDNDITHVSFIHCKALDDDVFEDLIQFCTLLEVIDITGSTGLSNYALKSLGESCPNLRELYITEGVFEDLNAEGLLSIAKGCPKFESFVCGEFNVDTELGELAKKCPKLNRLDIGMNQSLSKETLLTVAKNTTNLQSIEIDNFGLGNVTDKALVLLMQRNPHLRHVKIEFCQEVSAATFVQIPVYCPHLESLYLCNYESLPAEVFVSILEGCKALKKLAFVACDSVDDAVVKKIAQCCPLLTHLELTESAATFSAEALLALFTSCTQLEYLNLEDNVGTELDEATLRALGKNCPHLHTLLLNKCSFTESGLAQLATFCTTLRRLEAVSTDTSDAGLTAILSANKLLEYLNLSYCTKLTDTAMAAMAKHCGKLKHLRLESCTGITSNGFLCVPPGCKRLQEVWLSRNVFVNNKCITALAQHCPRLEFLRANECKKVTDAVAKVLHKHCRYLRVVELKDNVKVSIKKMCELEMWYNGQVTTDEFPEFD